MSKSATLSTPSPRPRKVQAPPASLDSLALARELAAEFRRTAVQRDRRNRPPLAELKKLRRSGLVNLLIPQRFGGIGGTVEEAAKVVFELSRGDASIAMLFTFHNYQALTPLLLRQEPTPQAVLRRSAEHFWLWGNITQYLKKAFVAVPHPEGGYVLNGTKSWNTGAPLADIAVVLAHHADRAEYIYSYIPTDRPGIEFQQDWDPVGLRGADSGRVTFKNARIYPADILPWKPTGEQQGPVPFWNIFRMVCSAGIHLGVAQETLDQARHYLKTEGRLHLLPGSAGPQHDPFIQAEFGELTIRLKSALAYFHHVIAMTRTAWESWDRLPPERRLEAQVEASSLRTLATQLALAVTPKIYDFTGGRATDNRFGFDRYWRDVRMLSMHDPIVYSIRGVGAYWLTGQWPKLSTHFDIPPQPKKDRSP